MLPGKLLGGHLRPHQVPRPGSSVQALAVGTHARWVSMRVVVII